MKRTALLVILALTSWGARADQGIPGLRVGAGAMFSQFKGDDVPAPELQQKFINDNTMGFRSYAQYQLNDWLAAEAAYHYTGDFEEKSKTAPLVGKLKLAFSGFSASGLFYIPNDIEGFQAFVRAGYYDFDDELSLNGSTVANSTERGLMAGAGAVLRLSDNLGLRADFDWFDADAGDLTSTNLSLEYYFGSREEAPVAVAAAAPPPPPPPPPAPEPAAPADADGDGVADEADQCPDTPQGDRVGPYGCSCDVTRQVDFAFDSADLTDAGRATLDEVAETLGRLKFVEGTVEGHTDAEGEADYNQSLSERRAQAVADYLQAKGVAAGRLRAVGYGESKPVADNETAEGRAQNRRVVLRRTDCDAPAQAE